MAAKSYDQAKHLILDCYGCSTQVLDNPQELELVMLKTAKKIKAKVLKSYFHKYIPQGVSGMVLIAESHLSIHTWPEQEYAAIDIFTCGTQTLAHLAPDYIKILLQVTNMKIMELERQVSSLY